MECVISRLYGLTLYEGRKHSLSLQWIVGLGNSLIGMVDWHKEPSFGCWAGVVDDTTS